MAQKKKDIMKEDLYGIIGVSQESTEKEILKAYRKKALKCHPDKNPDNPKAAELFHELSEALKVLTDPSAKAAYDNVLRAKKQAEERNRVLDSKRKKLKDDLEARENFADQRRYDDASAERNLQAEIERLRKEGSKLLEEEQARMREQMQTSTVIDDDSDSNVTESPKIKLRWNAKSCGDYDEDDLQALFNRYGDIANILVSKKKKGSAIIEFETSSPMLKLAENEHGTNANPLTVTWLSGKPTASSNSGQSHRESSVPKPNSAASTATFPVSDTSMGAGFGSGFGVPSAGDHKDFESLVLMKMRQAEERKRLIEQMQKEDEKNS